MNICIINNKWQILTEIIQKAILKVLLQKINITHTMRKFKILFGFGVIAGILSSCAPETIPADGDFTPDGKYTINYGVQVVPVGDVSRGVNNATVTIQTQNGVSTKTVGADGIAVFENLNAGTISGYVSSPGFASVNFKATCTAYNVDVNTNGYVSSTVYIPATNAEIAGRVYGNFDQDADVSLTDAGNFAIIDLLVKYTITGTYPMGNGDGALTQVSLDYTNYWLQTGSNGDFSLDSLPNTDLSYFTAILRMNDVVYVDPVTQAQTIMNFGNYALFLQPGEVNELGDIYAF